MSQGVRSVESREQQKARARSAADIYPRSHIPSPKSAAQSTGTGARPDTQNTTRHTSKTHDHLHPHSPTRTFRFAPLLRTETQQLRPRGRRGTRLNAQPPLHSSDAETLTAAVRAARSSTAAVLLLLQWATEAEGRGRGRKRREHRQASAVGRAHSHCGQQSRLSRRRRHKTDAVSARLCVQPRQSRASRLGGH